MKSRTYDDEYATCATTSVELRVWVPGMVSGEVASLLGLPGGVSPSDPYRTGRGHEWGAVGEAYSIGSGGAVASRDPRRHLDWVLSLVEERRGELDRLRHLPNSKMQLHCAFIPMYGDGGPMFWPDQLGAISRVGLELAVEAGFRPLEPPSHDLQPARSPRISPDSTHPTPPFDGYETCERVRAEVIVYTGNADPAKVTEAVGLQPTTSAAAGVPTTSPMGRLRASPRGRWVLESEHHVKSRDLRDHVDWLAGRLRGAESAIETLHERGLVEETVLRVAWWSLRGYGGPALWPDQQSFVAALGSDLWVELGYFGGESDVGGV
jgi:hypothetical protein